MKLKRGYPLLVTQEIRDISRVLQVMERWSDPNHALVTEALETIEKDFQTRGSPFARHFAAEAVLRNIHTSHLVKAQVATARYTSG